MSEQVIAREAARWWLLAHEGQRDEQAFEQWVQADPRNGRQYRHLQHLWEAGASLPSVYRDQRRRRRGIIAGATASLLVGLLLVSAGDLPAPPGQSLQTRTGQMREVILADGSRVLLAADTLLRAEIGTDHRRIVVQQGQALFTVAADAAHPFQVRTPHGTVTALGTAFDIHVGGDASVVTVTEHRVRVEGGKDVRTAAQGEQVRFDGQHATLPAPAEAGATAWQQHRIVQVMRPLSEVTAELDRWHGGKTLVFGRPLRTRPVSLIGATSEAAASRDQLARQLPVRVLHLGAGMQVWLPRTDASP